VIWSDTTDLDPTSVSEVSSPITNSDESTSSAELTQYRFLDRLSRIDTGDSSDNEPADDDEEEEEADEDDSSEPPQRTWAVEDIMACGQIGTYFVCPLLDSDDEVVADEEEDTEDGDPDAAEDEPAAEEDDDD
jgi:hypothetical protein